jgi:hypothetical protein
MASFVKLLLEQAERQAKARDYQAGAAQTAASGKTHPRTIIGGAGKKDEAGAGGEPWNKKEAAN